MVQDDARIVPGWVSRMVPGPKVWPRSGFSCTLFVHLCIMIKPFAEMTERDYAAVGFKSGLEIHQQLLTSKKLFCRCPAGRYSEEFNAEILRHMRPTLSELGEYDGTALMEFKTKKEIIYQIHRETVCTYEMDDTPPFELNGEALDIALGIGLLYGCSMVDEIHIARKQYLDGSIPTGFQRTTIVGVNGCDSLQGTAGSASSSLDWKRTRAGRSATSGTGGPT